MVFQRFGDVLELRSVNPMRTASIFFRGIPLGVSVNLFLQLSKGFKHEWFPNDLGCS